MLMDNETRENLLVHISRDFGLRDQIASLEDDRKEVRQSIEMIMRGHNMNEWPLSEEEARKLGLRVKLKPNRESRRMNYKRLMSEFETLYGELMTNGILKITPPKKMYRLEVLELKKRKGKAGGVE